MTVAAGRARVTSWATIMALSIVGAAPPAPATDCAAFAEQLTPHCPAARSLLLDRRQRLGFVGLLVAGADSSQQINDWTVTASDEPSMTESKPGKGYAGIRRPRMWAGICSPRMRAEIRRTRVRAEIEPMFVLTPSRSDFF